MSVGAPPMLLIEKQTLDGTAASIRVPESGNMADHANWPTDFTPRHIMIVVKSRTDRVVTHENTDIQMNGDTSSAYHTQRSYSSGTSAPVSARFDGQANILTGTIAGASATADTFGVQTIFIPNAFLTVGHGAVLALAGAAHHQNHNSVGRWASTAAITSLLCVPNIGPNYEAETTLEFYVLDERKLVGEVIRDSNGALSVGSIPSGTGSLSVIGYLRSDHDVADKFDSVHVDLNSDATDANYGGQTLQGLNTTMTTAAFSTRQVGVCSSEQAATGIFCPLFMTVTQFANTGADPFIWCYSGAHVGDSGLLRTNYNHRNNTEAVTSVGLVPAAGTEWVTGSGLWVYDNSDVVVDRQTGTGSSGLVTFDIDGLEASGAIPANTESLMINLYASNTELGGNQIKIELNDDETDANYAHQRTRGTGTTVSGNQSTASRFAGALPGTSEADREGSGSWMIPDYKGPNFKAVNITMGVAATLAVETMSVVWLNTAAITDIKMQSGGGAYSTDSVFELVALGPKLGWTGTVMGVANPGKVMGVERANIGKIMGVA